MIAPTAIQDIEKIHKNVNPGERFYGSTVVITGCAGFLGFYFLNYLVCYARTLGITRIIGLDNFLLEQLR